MKLFDFLKSKSKQTQVTNTHQETESIIDGPDVILAMPDHWNKDGHHFVNIEINEHGVISRYPGYIYATNNYVEYHCFKHVYISTVYKVLDEWFYYYYFDPYSTRMKLQKLWANEGFVFHDIIISGICERQNVEYSHESTQKEFYSHKYGFMDTVYIQHSDDAVTRWSNWHPNNDYIRVFSGSTPVSTGAIGVEWNQKRIYQIVYHSEDGTDNTITSEVRTCHSFDLITYW